MKPMLCSLLAAVALLGQTASTTAAPSDRGRERIERSVRREILRLPFYGVYDWITFQVDGYAVTLAGSVSRPTLKSGAERVVKKIEGVEKVTNNIEVLPLSPNDERIRRAVWTALSQQPALTRYVFRGPNSPIHIIVNNGNVALEGFVGNDGDKNIAGIQANGVPGVFSVKNNLRVDAARQPAKKK